MRIVKIQQDSGEYIDSNQIRFNIIVVENDNVKISTPFNIEQADSLENFLTQNNLTEYKNI